MRNHATWAPAPDASPSFALLPRVSPHADTAASASERAIDSPLARPATPRHVRASHRSSCLRDQEIVSHAQRRPQSRPAGPRPTANHGAPWRNRTHGAVGSSREPAIRPCVMCRPALGQARVYVALRGVTERDTGLGQSRCPLSPRAWRCKMCLRLREHLIIWLFLPIDMLVGSTTAGATRPRARGSRGSRSARRVACAMPGIKSQIV